MTLGPMGVTMPAVKRRKTDYYCPRCGRPLHNGSDKKAKYHDTVTGKLGPGNVVGFSHDQCRRGVVPGTDGGR